MGDPGLESLLTRLRATLEERSRALDLRLEFSAPTGAVQFAPAAREALLAGVEAALAALPRRAAHREGRGHLAFTLAPLRAGGELRALLEDDRPGLPARSQGEFFAGLEADPPALPADDLLGLASLSGALTSLGRRPDFFSSSLGSLLWWDLPVDCEGEGNGAPASPPAGWTRQPRLDRADLLRRLGGNAGIAERVIAVFREDAPLQLAALRQAKDLDALRRLCHGLKGASRNVGGLMLSEVARAGEREAAAGRADRVAAILPRLDWELTRLEAAWAEDT
jgi:HPt (histidine-containing phosphotransfer) domain-containing protein